MSFVLARSINFIFTVMEIAIFARVIISWIPVPRESRLIALLYQVTEPILAPIRGIIERSAFGRNMMFDFSPIVAFLLIGLVRSIILGFIPRW